MKYLTLEEQKRLVRTVREVKGAERDYVLIDLALNTGLRVRELAAVTVGDVRNKQRLWVRPDDMKFGRGRFVPLNVRIQDVLRKWLAHKMATLHESIEDLAPLFVSRLDKPMTIRGIQMIVGKWMMRAGLTTSLRGKLVTLYSTHSLRHTFAKRMQEREVPLTTIQKILGHASLASTGVYTEASEVEMEEAVHVLTIGADRAERMAQTL